MLIIVLCNVLLFFPLQYSPKKLRASSSMSTISMKNSHMLGVLEEFDDEDDDEDDEDNHESRGSSLTKDGSSVLDGDDEEVDPADFFTPHRGDTLGSSLLGSSVGSTGGRSNFVRKESAKLISSESFSESRARDRVGSEMRKRATSSNNT